MRIAQISYHYRPQLGGQEVYVDQLNAVFAAAGHTTHVYHASRRKWPGANTSVFYPPLIGRLAPHVNYFAFNLLLWLLHGRELACYDVIIVHYAFFSRPVWRLARKTIVLSHGVEWYPDERRLSDRIRHRVAAKAFDRFVTVANDTDYLRLFGMRIQPGEAPFTEVAKRKWFIPNCIDVERFSVAEAMPEFAGRKIVLVPRQISWDRGIDLAIRAFDIFRSNHADFSLLIVGGATRGAYYNRCVALVRQLGLEEQVLFAGSVGHAAMPGYYASAKVTLIPTRRREGTSLSALESMAAGTPTVSTDVVGLKDLPTLKVGLDPESIAKQLAHAVAQEASISVEQRAAVARTFNMANWTRAWLEVVRSIHAAGGDSCGPRES